MGFFLSPCLSHPLSISVLATRWETAVAKETNNREIARNDREAKTCTLQYRATKQYKERGYDGDMLEKCYGLSMKTGTRERSERGGGGREGDCRGSARRSRTRNWGRKSRRMLTDCLLKFSVRCLRGKKRSLIVI